MQVYDPWGCNTGMISSNDFRTGTTIELDGQVWRVVEFLHVKPGKGSAFVRTKLKSVQSGNVVEKTFRAGESVQQAILEKSNLQHTYVESGDYVFMDMTSFEETRLTSEQIAALTLTRLREGTTTRRASCWPRRGGGRGWPLRNSVRREQ